MGRKIFTREKSTIFVIVLVVFPPEVQTRWIWGFTKVQGRIWPEAKPIPVQ